MNNKEKLEAGVLHAVLKAVHNDSTRMSDSCQGMLHLVIRERIEELDESDYPSVEELADFVSELCVEIHSHTKRVRSQKRVVARIGLVKRILSIFENTWPFGN